MARARARVASVVRLAGRSGVSVARLEQILGIEAGRDASSFYYVLRCLIREGRIHRAGHGRYVIAGEEVAA